MAKLIETFTFDRNTFKRTPEMSAASVIEHMRLVQEGAPLDKTASNIVGALANYMGIFRRGDDQQIRTTDVAEAFLELHRQDQGDAWRWLVTRALWRWVIPNGTSCAANRVVGSPGTSIAFFYQILAVLKHLSALSGNGRYLYYDEFCEVYKEDEAWSLEPNAVFDRLMSLRGTNGLDLTNKRPLLGELENDYGIGRDNFNGLFHKGFLQTGLFEVAHLHRNPIGIAILTSPDKVQSRRIRFILDNPPEWRPEVPWQDYLSRQSIDLPVEASASQPNFVVEDVAPSPIEGLLVAAAAAFADANFRISESLLSRFVAALLAKPFVILTGMSGSGKTALARLFAAWIGSSTSPSGDCFEAGTALPADRITYFVTQSDSLSVELQNTLETTDATSVLLPRELIVEWAACIQENDFDRSTPPREIREQVATTTKFSTQLNSFETHLKACAFALLEYEAGEKTKATYEVVAVGADWTSNEHILGYPDALNPSKYCGTKALNLILAALRDPGRPYFLILDEMNLSHVERYFADFLSANESEEAIHLHSDLDENGLPSFRDGVPGRLKVPTNLFVLGTVNIDETTYMFSPKVLDRANTIEFRVTKDEMGHFADKPEGIIASAVSGAGAGYAQAFLSARNTKSAISSELQGRLKPELQLFFDILSDCGFEFGYRTVKETADLVYWHERLCGSDWNFRQAMDAAILQKLLPRIHGSRQRVEPLLCALAALCYQPRNWAPDGEPVSLNNFSDILEMSKMATELGDDHHPLNSTDYLGLGSRDADMAEYPESFQKIVRMLNALANDGFTSFAEA